jgi:DNA-directed RNA polymerase specialized sigma54-like protein
LEKEVQENPVLEVTFNQSPGREGEEDREKKDTGIETNGRDDNTILEYFSSRKGLIKGRGISAFEREHDINRLKEGFRKISLSEHLLLNFRIIARDELESKIGEYLIGNINYNGYLVISCQEAAQDLNIGEKKVIQVLAMIQNCSIHGLGARNLK